MVKNLLARICTLEGQNTNWHQLLQKARNRISALEAAFRAIPSAQPQNTAVSDGCDGLDATVQPEAIIACQDGDERALKPSTSGISSIVGCDGKWRVDTGFKRYYPHEDLPFSVTVEGNTGTVTGELDVSEYLPEDFEDCINDVYAAFIVWGRSIRVGTGNSPTVYFEVTTDGVTWTTVTQVSSTPIADGSGGFAIFKCASGDKLKYRVRNLSAFGDSTFHLTLVGLFV